MNCTPNLRLVGSSPYLRIGRCEIVYTCWLLVWSSLIITLCNLSSCSEKGTCSSWSFTKGRESELFAESVRVEWADTQQGTIDPLLWLTAVLAKSPTAGLIATVAVLDSQGTEALS